jgi:uncharacterized membrane protein
MRQEKRRTRGGELTVGGILLGMGLGGFVDGIVLHQILQWHHMGTATGSNESFPSTTVAALERNTLWDGLFHAGAWALALAGVILLWRATRGGRYATWRTLAGLLLVGWGLFNVIEGLVNHQLLRIHHVRDDLGGPLSWDLGFLVFGVLLLGLGLTLWQTDEAREENRVRNG